MSFNSRECKCRQAMWLPLSLRLTFLLFAVVSYNFTTRHTYQPFIYV